MKKKKLKIISKINRKILSITFWSLALVGLFAVMGFVNFERNTVLCESIQIDINNENGHFFVEQDDVLALIKREGIELKGKPLSAINYELLEQTIHAYPYVKEVQVYSTISGELNFEITQREPILRVMSYEMGSFYLDVEGKRMPLSNRYTARVTLANGSISQTMLNDLFLLATFVNKNSFWESQVQQIYVDWAGEIQLIPRVGKHKILLGGFDDLEGKFSKLMVFYKEGLNRIGWNRYKTIDLRYKDQVVCTKL